MAASIEKRCDLSPDGTKLVYFAARFNAHTLRDQEYTYAWSGVSKIPWLTALALWPKGDCWHGGGLFETNKRLWLNHQPSQATPHPEHLPHGLTVVANPEACGEDAPVYLRRLKRDGWVLRQEQRVRYTRGSFVTEVPGIHEKKHHDAEVSLVMTTTLAGFKPRQEFTLRDELADQTVSAEGVLLEGATQADFDQSGRLIFVRAGKLFAASARGFLTGEVQELADFNSAQPERTKAPAWARTW